MQLSGKQDCSLPHPRGRMGTARSCGVLHMLSRGDVREPGSRNDLVNISSIGDCKWVQKCFAWEVFLPRLWCWSNLLSCYRIFAALVVFVWQGYESPCSDKPPSLTLWSESLTKTHPWPRGNTLCFIKAGFPASVSLGCLETDSLEGCRQLWV